METPKRMGVVQSLAKISEYFTVHCRLDGPRHLTCAHCGGEISAVRAFMSLHDERFGDSCVGPGRAWRMEIPYCAACESPPSRYGCLHMSEADLNLPSVVEASRPFGQEHPEYARKDHNCPGL